MSKHDSIHACRGISTVEFLSSITILMALFLMALFGLSGKSYYEIPKLKAYMADITSYAHNRQNAMMVYYNLHGTWPKDQVFTQDDELRLHSSVIRSAREEGGAIHLLLDIPLLNLAGKTVSYRPATPLGNPMGPVRWICGKRVKGSAWHISGINRTNIDENLLLRECRDSAI